MSSFPARVPSANRCDHSKLGPVNAMGSRSAGAELRLGFRQGKFAASFKVCEPGEYGAHEGPLVIGRLIVGDRLNHCESVRVARLNSGG